MREERSVNESITEMVEVVLPNDTNSFGNVLGGKVMHWIDLAGAIAANRHCRRPVVTASIDAIDFHYPIKVGQIVVLKAVVNYVGNSSIEVGVDVFSEDPITGNRIHTSSAFLTFVALDDERRPVQVPRLLLKTEEEKMRNKDAGERRRSRLKRIRRIES